MNINSFLKRFNPGKPHLIIILLAAIFLLPACAVRQTGNWPTVSSSGSKLYVAYQQDVIALDAESKSEAWRFANENSAEFYAPPAAIDEDGDGNNIVYLADFGRSAGIFAGGGLIVSMYALEERGNSQPLPLWVSEEEITGRIVSGLLIEDGVIYTGTSNNQIIAVDRTNGNLLWETPTGNAIWSPPSSLDGTIFVSSIDRNIYAVNQDDGSIKWTHTLNGAGAATPIISQDQQRVYAGSFGGEVIALNPEDGSDIWATSGNEKDWIWGAPVEIANELIFGDVDGKVYSVDILTGEQIWEASVTGTIVGDIIVSGDVILVGSGEEETLRGFMTAFSLDGKELWRTETKANLQSSPVLVNDGEQIASVYGSLENDVILGVDVIDVADGSVYWTWTYTEE